VVKLVIQRFTISRPSLSGALLRELVGFPADVTAAFVVDGGKTRFGNRPTAVAVEVTTN
jgi:hypothetical protein